MQFARETIYSALFTLLSTVSDWNYTDRRFHLITELSDGQYPAMMMVQKTEEAEVNGRGIPIKWVLCVDVVVYVDTTNDPDRIPAQVMNPILDNLEAVIQPNVTNVMAIPQTLGGMVSQCRIRGKVMTDEGTLGSRGFIVVPVEIVVQS